MAFDMMIAKTGRRDRINHDEEYFLKLVHVEDLDCPNLYRIWDDFYKGPSLYPNHSAQILQELSVVDRFIQKVGVESIDVRQWFSLNSRLLAFFQEAVSESSMIYTESD